MQIFFSYYQLKKNSLSNSRTSSSVQIGALIKVVDDDGNFGVADLCPWPSLGDLQLDAEIGGRGLLFQRALALAAADQQARIEHVQLVDRTEIENHYLVNDIQNFEAFAVEAAPIVKIKGSKDYNLTANWLIKNQLLLQKIRLDFNSCLSESEFENFINLLPTEIFRKIELIEDPFPFNLQSWTRWNQKIKIAADFVDAEFKKKWPNTINKPARENFDSAADYLTSSMDHPVGIAHGLHFAQKLPNKTHGFLTFDKYAPTDYTAAFTHQGITLKYDSDGFGIGFTELLSKENWVPQIEWNKDQSTMVVFNSQSNSDHIRALFDIKKKFSIEHPKNYILIPSSGSTQQAGDHRVFAFGRQQILNSAARVNKHFGLNQNLSWGCVLPLFHVGGLGILARAYLTHSKVFFNTWSEFSTDWITENNINLLSLVPTQIFDIVAKGMRAPNCMKFVFVGGAHLDQQLHKEALDLGWPLVLTYGMTETASMIAFRNSNGFFQLFEGVRILSSDNRNFVQANSLANFQVKYSAGSIVTTELSANNAGIELPDAIEIFDSGQFTILGRTDDQIKINGELVNLNAIRALLPNGQAHHLDIVAIDDLRKGKRIVLVGEMVGGADSKQVSGADGKQVGSTDSEKQKLDGLKALALKINSGLKKFEKIELVTVVRQFPRSGLNKIKTAELKNELEKENKYENV